ncbi:hypothetical protein SAMN06298226_2144 [Nitrosovibrio sp. Nv4]|nr:hypothetical protein SAMN06298226_2144 [Nitrosovibrio sp. Nv4]
MVFGGEVAPQRPPVDALYLAWTTGTAHREVIAIANQIAGTLAGRLYLMLEQNGENDNHHDSSFIRTDS